MIDPSRRWSLVSEHFSLFFFLFSSLGGAVACGKDTGDSSVANVWDTETGGAGGEGGAKQSGGGFWEEPDPQGGSGGQFLDASLQDSASAGAAGNVVVVPPDSAFIAAEIGSYALGELISEGDLGDTGLNTVDGEGCEVMLAIVRDFRGANESDGHPDFEAFSGSDATLGLVADSLGTDRKPVYDSLCEATFDPTACPYGQQTTSKTNFDQWYRYTQAVNKTYPLFLKLAANEGVYTFSSSSFFPLDDTGWGNTPTYEHNFGFTTELHTRFKYEGGEVFRFTGDDDVWVFINGKLAVDLGGLHPSSSKNVDLDAVADKFGLVKGNAYSLELFHAERHSTASNFRMDTNLDFMDCGTIVPDIPK